MKSRVCCVLRRWSVFRGSLMFFSSRFEQHYSFIVRARLSEIFIPSWELQSFRDFEFQYGEGSPPCVSLGRLRQCLNHWHDFGTSSTVLNWIANGVPIRWRLSPPAPRAMKNSMSVVKYRKFIDEAVSQLLSVGAIQQVR